MCPAAVEARFSMQGSMLSDLASDIRKWLTSHQSLLIIDNVDDIETILPDGPLDWVRDPLGRSRALITTRASRAAQELEGTICFQLTPEDNTEVMEAMLARHASGSDAELVLRPGYQVCGCIVMLRAVL
jgi:hypothetical protein